MAKTITLNSSPTWPGVKDDYVLRYEGHAIGRIRRVEAAWEWHIAIPMAVPEWGRGSGDNLGECGKAFASAWGRFLNETSPARLERAWELERAAEAWRPREATGKSDKAPDS